MRLIIALLLPWLTFFTIGRPIAGIICLILQITIVGWLPATIWAVYALGQYKTDKKIEKALSQRSAYRLRPGLCPEKKNMKTRLQLKRITNRYPAVVSHD